MNNELVTLRQARDAINHLVQGVDPYTGEVLGEVAFMQNPKMIRTFAFMSDVLTASMERRRPKKARIPFYITEEELERVEFPEGDIGVLQIVKAINASIQDEARGKLTAALLNKSLKKAGVLSAAGEDEQYRTVVNERSAEFGIKAIESTYRDEKYMQVVYSDQAKKYLKDNLIELMEQDQGN